MSLPVRYLTETEAVALATSRDLHDHYKWAVGDPSIFDFTDPTNPNRRYGLPRTFRGERLVVVDPFVHHLLPGRV